MTVITGSLYFLIPFAFSARPLWPALMGFSKGLQSCLFGALPEPGPSTRPIPSLSPAPHLVNARTDYLLGLRMAPLANVLPTPGASWVQLGHAALLCGMDNADRTSSLGPAAARPGASLYLSPGPRFPICKVGVL